MHSINWPLHFLLLLIAIASLSFIEKYFGNVVPLFLFTAGAVHALTLAMATTGRSHARLPILILFVIGTGLLSYFAVMVGMGISILLPYSSARSDLVIIGMSASTVGAVTYGWLVRKVLLPHIPLGLLLIAAPLFCVLATFIVLHFHLRSSIVHLPTVSWWLAFSLCIFVVSMGFTGGGRFQGVSKCK